MGEDYALLDIDVQGWNDGPFEDDPRASDVAFLVDHIQDLFNQYPNLMGLTVRASIRDE